MSGLLWKLAVAGGVVAAVRAYQRRNRAQPAAVFSQDGAYRAVPDDGSFTPPHGDVVSATAPSHGGGNGTGLGAEPATS